MSRLLILSCSRKKRADRGRLPALQRYDGPPFRLLRRYLQLGSGGLDVYILSAKYGLIHYDEPIPFYDLIISPERAVQLQPVVMARVKEILRPPHPASRHSAVFVNVGRDYMPTLSRLREVTDRAHDFFFAQGSSGKRLSAMHDWLYGATPPAPSPARRPPAGGVVRLRGVCLSLTPEQVLGIARAHLEEDRDGANSYQSWFVPVGGHRVSPKWLVSRLTHLPVRSFHSGDARRILNALGVEVLRV